MLHTETEIETTDYGTGATGKGTIYRRIIADIARTSLESPRVGQLFFKWIAYLGHEAQRPLEIIELGTSLGITTAYLAAPDSRNRITTFEGSPAVADIARQNWEKLNLHNINIVVAISITHYIITRERKSTSPTLMPTIPPKPHCDTLNIWRVRRIRRVFLLSTTFIIRHK